MARIELAMNKKSLFFCDQVAATAVVDKKSIFLNVDKTIKKPFLG